MRLFHSCPFVEGACRFFYTHIHREGRTEKSQTDRQTARQIENNSANEEIFGRADRPGLI